MCASFHSKYLRIRCFSYPEQCTRVLTPLQVAWETVKACYAEMSMEAERLKKVLDEGIPVAVDTKVVKVAPAARVTKAITVTRAAKMGFDRTVRQAGACTHTLRCAAVLVCGKSVV